jgi:hypothetical protein
MGSAASLQARFQWENPDAIKYAAFLCRLLGPPNHGDGRRGGALVWDREVLRNRRLFGQPMPFHRIIVKDQLTRQEVPQPHYNYMYVIVAIPSVAVTETDAADLYTIYTGSGYNFEAGRMWVSCNTLEQGIMIAEYLADYIDGGNASASTAGLTTAINSAYASTGKIDPTVVASAYLSLRSSLLSLIKKARATTEPALPPIMPESPSLDPKSFAAQKERFSSVPNAPEGDYISNNPLQLALEQDWDDKFYNRPRPYAEGTNELASPAYASNQVDPGRLEALKAARAAHRRELLTVKSGNTASVSRSMPVPKGRSILRPGNLQEHLADRTTDPRFLYGSGDDYRQVGSDTNSIDRVYGTVDQKIRYPTYSDMVSYGVTGVPAQPLDYYEQRMTLATAVSGDFRPSADAGPERFVDAGNAAVLAHVKSTSGNPDPFLSWMGAS